MGFIALLMSIFRFRVISDQHIEFMWGDAFKFRNDLPGFFHFCGRSRPYLVRNANL